MLCFCCFNKQAPLLCHSHLTQSSNHASFPLLHHGYFTPAHFTDHTATSMTHNSPTRQLMKHNASKTSVCISCSRYTIKQRCCNTGSCCSCNLPYISPSASHQCMVHYECMVVLYQHSSIGIPQARGRFATVIHCESCYTLNIVFNLVHSDCNCIGVA